MPGERKINGLKIADILHPGWTEYYPAVVVNLYFYLLLRFLLRHFLQNLQEIIPLLYIVIILCSGC